MYLKLNKLNRVFWMALGVLLLTNCSKDEPEALRIHEELEVYFDNFVNEAAARGIAVDWESNPIEGFLQEIPNTTVAGQCTYHEESPNRIVVDVTTWNRASDLDREYIVFHELGHCYLGRSHRDEINSNGTCVSIMQSGTIRCNTNYSTRTRSDYLDELFE